MILQVLDSLARAVLVFCGGVIIAGVCVSAMRTFVLARSARDALTAFVFLNIRKLFNLRMRSAKTYADRDRIMAMYTPVSLLSLPIMWLFMIWIGYGLIYIAIGVARPERALILSGSSLLTLGFANEETFGLMILEFSEATIGLILIAILIAYLPTMYSAFSNREKQVTLLEVRAGMPPSALEMLTRAHSINGFASLHDLFITWEDWFADLQESHTSLAPLVFFRSTKPEMSWVTAAGAVLDSAAMYLSTVDVPNDPQAALCIRSGYLALRHIADFFRIQYHPDPHFPAQSISISRAEYDEVYNELATAGVPVKVDRDQAWHDFAGWRVNYDMVLLRLAALTMAPYAMWSSDRSLPQSAGQVKEA